MSELSDLGFGPFFERQLQTVQDREEAIVGIDRLSAGLTDPEVHRPPSVPLRVQRGQAGNPGQFLFWGQLEGGDDLITECSQFLDEAFLAGAA